MSNLLPQNLFSVRGKTIAITGAGEFKPPIYGTNSTDTDQASGIGRMLAKGFAVNGSNTILIDINEEQLVTCKKESEEAAQSVGITTSIHTYENPSKPQGSIS